MTLPQSVEKGEDDEGEEEVEKEEHPGIGAGLDLSWQAIFTESDITLCGLDTILWQKSRLLLLLWHQTAVLLSQILLHSEISMP